MNELKQEENGIEKNIEKEQEQDSINNEIIFDEKIFEEKLKSELEDETINIKNPVDYPIVDKIIINEIIEKDKIIVNEEIQKEIKNTYAFINKISSFFSNVKNNNKFLNKKKNKINKEEANDFELDLAEYKHQKVFIKNGIVFVKESIYDLKEQGIKVPTNTLVYVICEKQFIIQGIDWWIAIPKNTKLEEINYEKIDFFEIEVRNEE